MRPRVDVKFRIVLVGVTANSTDVGDLVSRLDSSAYFRDVGSTGYSTTKLDVPSGRRSTPAGQGAKGTADEKIKVQVSEFQITCYLANFDEIESE